MALRRSSINRTRAYPAQTRCSVIVKGIRVAALTMRTAPLSFIVFWRTRRGGKIQIVACAANVLGPSLSPELRLLEVPVPIGLEAYARIPGLIRIERAKAAPPGGAACAR